MTAFQGLKRNICSLSSLVFALTEPLFILLFLINAPWDLRKIWVHNFHWQILANTCTPYVPCSLVLLVMLRIARVFFLVCRDNMYLLKWCMQIHESIYCQMVKLWYNGEFLWIQKQNKTKNNCNESSLAFPSCLED